LRPHAKINLGLRILGVRRDGYHEIRTRFQSVDLTDTLEFEKAPREVDLRVEGAPLPADRSNLVMKAAEALREGRPGLPGAKIRLTKSIPLAAGLGGGSSDAATTLLGLNRLWRLGLGPEDLRRIASGLGADVPFFLEGGTALGEGRGDEIRSLPDLRGYRICMILAPYGFSTLEAYRQWDLRPALPEGAAAATGSTPGPSLVEVPGNETSETVHNDLQDVVFAIHPELKDFQDLLYRAGAQAASLSGSGPSLFGLFRSAEQAHAFRISREWAPFRVLECTPVTRGGYQKALGLGPAADAGSS